MATWRRDKTVPRPNGRCQEEDLPTRWSRSHGSLSLMNATLTETQMVTASQWVRLEQAISNDTIQGRCNSRYGSSFRCPDYDAQITRGQSCRSFLQQNELVCPFLWRHSSVRWECWLVTRHHPVWSLVLCGKTDPKVQHGTYIDKHMLWYVMYRHIRRVPKVLEITLPFCTLRHHFRSRAARQRDNNRVPVRK